MRVTKWEVLPKIKPNTMNITVQPSSSQSHTPDTITKSFCINRLQSDMCSIYTIEDISKCVTMVAHRQYFDTDAVDIFVEERSREYVREYYTIIDDVIHQQVIVNAYKGKWAVQRVYYTLECIDACTHLNNSIKHKLRNELNCESLTVGESGVVYALSQSTINDDYCYFIRLRDGSVVKKPLPIPVLEGSKWVVTFDMMWFAALYGETIQDVRTRIIEYTANINSLIPTTYRRRQHD